MSVSRVMGSFKGLISAWGLVVEKLAFEVDLPDISLSCVFLFVGFKDEDKELDCIAEKHVSIHFLILRRLLGQHRVGSREEICVEDLWMRFHLS